MRKIVQNKESSNMEENWKKALDKSIKIWEKRHKTGIYENRKCPLCDLADTIQHHQEENISQYCGECPINIITEGDGCWRTPFYNVPIRDKTLEFKKAAEIEVEFLKAVRDNPEKAKSMLIPRVDDSD